MIRPDVYWVREIEAVRLAIMPRPRSAEWLADEIAGLRNQGVTVVVSLLELSEERELGILEEGPLCRAAGIEFLSFPIVDRGLPADEVEFRALVESLVRRLKAGDAVAIHCRAAIGRSGVLGACVLSALGVGADEALRILGRARGVVVPDTEAQASFVRRFTAEL